MFRNLYPHEIEVRVQQCKSNGCSLLLYKDARCDMAILDETVTPMYWQRSHIRDNKNCIVSIYDDTLEQWVSKEDTGTESNTEQAKGLASDSFKRACFNWGIGRELYSSPFIWIKLEQNEVNVHGQKARLNFGVKFRVSKIYADHNKHIQHLEIVDNMNKVRFVHGKDPSVKAKINDILKNKMYDQEKRKGYLDDLLSKHFLPTEQTIHRSLNHDHRH